MFRVSTISPPHKTQPLPGCFALAARLFLVCLRHRHRPTAIGIRNVRPALRLVAIGLVLKYPGADVGEPVTHMRVVIDGGAAGVDADVRRFERLEFLNLAGKGIV